MRSLSLEDLHGLLLNIAKEFHRICEENHIPYFMLGGTMLGAVRHKGFIPWDDDMDFGVPREHFEKLKRALKQGLPPEMDVLTQENSDALVAGFIKIEDTRAVTKEQNTMGFAPIGANVDIFPLDKCDGKTGRFSKCRLIGRLMSVQMYRFAISAKERPFPKNLLNYFIKTALFWLKKDDLLNYIDKHLMTDGDYIANYYGAWGYKETMPATIFSNRILYDFEDTQLYGVKDYDTYLKNLYNDYMQLPPEDQRHIHLQYAYWKEDN
ncbi:MAG: LicD family protein [Prevotellaceae bacterium]|nr:LicD family protein [Prevotellaceae bacterium]